MSIWNISRTTSRVLAPSGGQSSLTFGLLPTPKIIPPATVAAPTVATQEVVVKVDEQKSVIVDVVPTVVSGTLPSFDPYHNRQLFFDCSDAVLIFIYLLYPFQSTYILTQMNQRLRSHLELPLILQLRQPPRHRRKSLPPPCYHPNSKEWIVRCHRMPLCRVVTWMVVVSWRDAHHHGYSHHPVVTPPSNWDRQTKLTTISSCKNDEKNEFLVSICFFIVFIPEMNIGLANGRTRKHTPPNPIIIKLKNIFLIWKLCYFLQSVYAILPYYFVLKTTLVWSRLKDCQFSFILPSNGFAIRTS